MVKNHDSSQKKLFYSMTGWKTDSHEIPRSEELPRPSQQT